MVTFVPTLEFVGEFAAGRPPEFYAGLGEL